jgi:hypothetical protein
VGRARSQPSDVTAIVLTLGEGTTGRAIASLDAQSRPPAEVVLVEGVTPFHVALTQGASQVRTPFFIQVDADMVLDPTCIETLRSAMRPGLGIVVGQLRDPLMAAPITGIKLFRTDCLAEARWRDSIIQDVDFYVQLAWRGWATANILAPDRHHSVGEHRPDYTLEYTYSTYHQLGARHRYFRDLLMLTRRIGLLRRSPHPMAPVARLALGHGAFSLEERDVPKTPPDADEREVLSSVAAAGATPERLDAEGLLGLPPEESADAFSRLGASLRAAADYRGVAAWLELLEQPAAEDTWLAEASFCHGVLAGTAAGPVGGLLDDMRRGIRDTVADR